MRLAIRALVDGEPGPEEVAAFLDRHEFPLQEGTTTTFVYRGEAEEVRLRHFIYGLPSTQRFERIADTDLWFLVFELPERSRIEYKLEVARDGSSEWILDPLNPVTARDPFGANSVCQAAGYERPDWTEEDPDARRGEIQEIVVDSETFGESRPLRVYVPARIRPARSYPLLIVHDGPDFLRYSGLRSVLDNLIYRLEIPPLLVALTESPNRLQEYAADPGHGIFWPTSCCPSCAPAIRSMPAHRRSA